KFGAAHRIVEAVHAAGIGPGDEDKRRIATCRDRRPQLGRHHRRLDELLAREMATALGEQLVLQVQTGSASLLEELYGPLGVEGVAEASVGIAKEGQRGGAGDRPGGVGELGHAEQANVGEASRGRQSSAGQIYCLESAAFGQAGDERIEYAGHLEGAGGPGLAQSPSRRWTCLLFHDRDGPRTRGAGFQPALALAGWKPAPLQEDVLWAFARTTSGRAGHR